MLSRVFLSGNKLLNTTCTKCREYLSVPPIVMKPYGPVCGRCILQCDDLENRAYFYEDLAKLMFFPCIYDVHGCNVQSPWETVLEHEMNCKFKIIICPATNCEKIYIGTDKILHHFNIDHKDLILTENEDSVRIIKDTSILWMNKLYMWKERAFIIQTKIHGSNYFFRISSFQEEPVTALSVTLTLLSKETSNSVNLSEFKVMKYVSKYPEFDNKERIDINGLKHSLGIHIICVFKCESLVSPNNTINNEKMMSEVECQVCTNYMTPPIYMCPTGHSLCGSCRVRLIKCPSCSAKFSNTRNFSLERITELITYPCVYKNRGCDFVGSIRGVKDHEFQCSKSQQSEISCLMTSILPCIWKGYYSNMFQHITSVHSHHCIKLRYPLTIDLHNNTVQRLFFQYDARIFKVYIDLSKLDDKKIRWGVSCIKCSEKLRDKYKFYLDFSNDKKTFTISHVCLGEHVHLKKPKPNYINIPVYLLNPFIKENKITVQINMLKLVD